MSCKIIIVTAEYNKKISDNLYNGAKQKYIEYFNESEYNQNIQRVKVPGAFEIPGIINKILNENCKYDAIIAFGSVIKGETAHFEYISKAVTEGVMRLSIRESSKIPILFGILTAYNYEQAEERSDINRKNKGGEVMQAAIDTVKAFNF